MDEIITEAEFWQLIAASRKGWKSDDLEGSRERQAARLKRLLLPLSTSKLMAFERHFRRFHEAAYHWDLWEAAYWFQGGCSDDGFTDFRAWLISMGQEAYEAALQNPDTLADVFAELDDEDVEFEAFGYICGDVMKARMGRYPSEEELFPPIVMASEGVSSPDLEPTYASPPKGEPYPKEPEANEAAVARRMPRLYALFMDIENKCEAARETL